MTFPSFNLYAYAVLCEDWFYHRDDDAGKIMTILTDVFTSLLSLYSPSNVSVTTRTVGSPSSTVVQHPYSVPPNQDKNDDTPSATREAYLDRYLSTTLRKEGYTIHKRLQDIGILDMVLPNTTGATGNVSSSRLLSIETSSSSAVSSVPTTTKYTLKFRWQGTNTILLSSLSSSSFSAPSLNELITAMEKTKNSIRSTIHFVYLYEKQRIFNHAIAIAQQQRNTIGSAAANTQIFTHARHRIQATYDLLYQLVWMVHPSMVNKKIPSRNTHNDRNGNVRMTTMDHQRSTDISNSSPKHSPKDAVHIDKKIKNSPFSSLQRIFAPSVATGTINTLPPSSFSSSSSLPSDPKVSSSTTTLASSTTSTVPSSLILPIELLPVSSVSCTTKDTLLNSYPLWTFLYVFFATQLEISSVSPHIRVGARLEDAVFLEAVPNMDIARIFLPSFVYFLVLTLGCTCGDLGAAATDGTTVVHTIETPAPSSLDTIGSSSFRMFPVSRNETDTKPSPNSEVPFFTYEGNRIECTSVILQEIIGYIEGILGAYTAPVIGASIKKTHRWELPSDVSNRLLSALLFESSSLYTSSTLLHSLEHTNTQATRTTSSWSFLSPHSRLPLLLPPSALEYRLPSFPVAEDGDKQFTVSIPVLYTPLVDGTNKAWKLTVTPGCTPNIRYGSKESNHDPKVPLKSRTKSTNCIDSVCPGQFYYIEDKRTNIDGAMDT